MALCLTQTADGFQLANPQPTQYTTCTHLVASPNELASNYTLTANEGLQISMAIIVVWGVGFAFRAIATMLKQGNENEQN